MRLTLHQVVFGLGPGVLGATGNRMGVWTQGCSLPKCPGCCSAHTWRPEEGRSIRVEALLKAARAQVRTPTGLTVSGGEPTDQAEPLTGLIRGFRRFFPGTEVILYSGLRWPVLQARHQALIALLDVVISGPYVRTLRATPLSGSSNQEVRLLTPLARKLYKNWRNWPMHSTQVVSANETRVVTVGIPDTTRMSRAAEKAGVIGVSWGLTRGSR